MFDPMTYDLTSEAPPLTGVLLYGPVGRGFHCNAGTDRVPYV